MWSRSARDTKKIRIECGQLTRSLHALCRGKWKTVSRISIVTTTPSFRPCFLCCPCFRRGKMTLELSGTGRSGDPMVKACTVHSPCPAPVALLACPATGVVFDAATIKSGQRGYDWEARRRG